MMTLRAKLVHLHHRLAFGATPAELDRDEKLGLDRAIDRLIDYEKVDEEFPVSPWEFAWQDKGEADPGSYNLRGWWTFRMIATQRPLQEKLTLFWHSHFAAGDSKVEDGPMMLDYVEGLRANANGKFVNILRSASQSPAIMRYLDMTRSMRGHPNENFAREVMELFTLGIDGGYTEQDVKEVSRALTGWGMIHFMYELPGTTAEKLRDAIKYQRPFSSYTYMPTLHDPGEKTILGKTKNWNGEQVLDLLANHPKTAERVALKMWQFFGLERPQKPEIEAVANAFRRSQGDVKVTMRALVKHPAFWSDACVQQMPKSPADFVVGMARAQGMGRALMAERDPNATAYTRIAAPPRDQAGYASYRMIKMGLELMNPPDVSGWKWGSAFITPAMMAERYQYQGLYIGVKDKPDVATQNVISWIAAQKPSNNAEFAARFCEAYGVTPTPSTLSQMAKALEGQGGFEALKETGRWGGFHYVGTRLLAAAPEMHVC